jgi:hypothetical protein
MSACNGGGGMAALVTLTLRDIFMTVAYHRNTTVHDRSMSADAAVASGTAAGQVPPPADFSAHTCRYQLHIAVLLPAIATPCTVCTDWAAMALALQQKAPAQNTQLGRCMPASDNASHSSHVSVCRPSTVAQLNAQCSMLNAQCSTPHKSTVGMHSGALTSTMQACTPLYRAAAQPSRQLLLASSPLLASSSLKQPAPIAAAIATTATKAAPATYCITLLTLRVAYVVLLTSAALSSTSITRSSTTSHACLARRAKIRMQSLRTPRRTQHQHAHCSTSMHIAAPACTWQHQHAHGSTSATSAGVIPLLVGTRPT